MSRVDWRDWHDDYDDPASSLSRRLRAVQARVREALDDRPPGEIRVVSLCAGQGRDLLGVLVDHPRRQDVRARLVELDPRNTAVAAAAAAASHLENVDVVTADASLTDHYLDLAPADLVLACGIFGNITDADVMRTIDHCAGLCREGGTVLWTRHRGAPDLVPSICERFAERGFELRWLSDPDAGYGVGAHVSRGSPRPLAAGERMFTFVGRQS
ncbi:SAM-dependent methyltransferase [Stackebrandtia sp.]|uniref:SAM-dependent methyltransferase n=1 Tax=Stackebrandtia sp. TaxID=2023065 RepID=UPI0032C21A4D